jgi:hypothetical protein
MCSKATFNVALTAPDRPTGRLSKQNTAVAASSYKYPRVYVIPQLLTRLTGLGCSPGVRRSMKTRRGAKANYAVGIGNPPND